jgi:hypothetical protein
MQVNAFSGSRVTADGQRGLDNRRICAYFNPTEKKYTKETK